MDFEQLMTVINIAGSRCDLSNNFHITVGSYGGFIVNTTISKTSLSRSGFS